MAKIKLAKAPFLFVSGISKTGSDGLVLDAITFQQKNKQKIAIAGETGSGKTTLLRTIAGLEQPDLGKILFQNEEVVGPSGKLVPGHANIAYLSQYFELPKYLRVEQVLEYANTLTQKEANRLFELCQVDHLLKRKTDELSGGERQRIALARCLVKAPQLLLLDEPFSNLDVIQSNILKSVIYYIGAKLGITCILVSHEPLDTLSWADEIVVLRGGKIVQQGPPHVIYHKPIDKYVAGLFGRFRILKNKEAKAWGIKTNLKQLIIRPEQFYLSGKKTKGSRKGKVIRNHFYGSHSECEISLPSGKIRVRTTSSSFAIGSNVYVKLRLG